MIGILAFLACASACASQVSGNGADSDKDDDLDDDDDGADDDDDGDDGGVTGIELSQTSSDTIKADNSVACLRSDNGDVTGHGDNSYYRLFDLDDFGEVDGDFRVRKVFIGIQVATGPGGSQPGTVTIYGQSAGMVLDPIASEDIQIADQELELLEVPLDATVEAGSTFAVSLHTPDSNGDGTLLFIGTNDQGQTRPSYLSSTTSECDVPEPTDVSELGYENSHMVIKVVGDDV
jgi:hypothetical protein